MAHCFTTKRIQFQPEKIRTLFFNCDMDENQDSDHPQNNSQL